MFATLLHSSHFKNTVLTPACQLHDQGPSPLSEDFLLIQKQND